MEDAYEVNLYVGEDGNLHAVEGKLTPEHVPPQVYASAKVEKIDTETQTVWLAPVNSDFRHLG
jgi:hypothetical protein